MRIGRLHLRLVKRHRSAVCPRFDATACYACLGALAASLHGQPWMIVSGLVEPLRSGRFDRTHSDIDIAVPLAHLCDATEAALRAGYVLTTRVLRTHWNRELDLEIHVCIDPRHLERRSRRLRLWRLTAAGELDDSGFPPYVDVFPYTVADGEMRILDTGDRMKLGCPLAVEISLPGGAVVPIEDPYYLKATRIPGKPSPSHNGSALKRLWSSRR